MEERSMSEDGYRFGFNGKENDRDFGNDQLIQDYGFRVYNPALGKFLSLDPLFKSYPYYTPYQFAGNKPIAFIDLDGLEEAPPKKHDTKPAQKAPGILDVLFSLDKPLGDVDSDKEMSYTGDEMSIPWWFPIPRMGIKKRRSQKMPHGNSRIMPYQRPLPEIDPSNYLGDIPQEDENYEYFYRAMSMEEFASVMSSDDPLVIREGGASFISPDPRYLLNKKAFIHKNENKEKYNVIVQFKARKGTNEHLEGVSIPEGTDEGGGTKRARGANLPVKKLEGKSQLKSSVRTFGFYNQQTVKNHFNRERVVEKRPIWFRENKQD